MERTRTMEAEHEALVVDFGPGNEGEFGPTPEVEARYHDFVLEVSNPEYRRRSNNVWICVDGRESERQDELGIDDESAPAQMPGSLPIVNTAGDMMDDTFDDDDLRLSDRVAANTRAAVGAGRRVIVHGDDHHGKDGCAANKQMRATLTKVSDEAEVVVPLSWAFCKIAGLEDLISQEDVSDAVAIAGRRAANDEIWDIKPEEVPDVAVANGAEYHALKGKHLEAAVAVPREGTYAAQKFAQDYEARHGQRVEVFVATIHEYVKATIEDMVATGWSERDGALKAMRGIIYTAGLSKKIGKPTLRGILF